MTTDHDPSTNLDPSLIAFDHLLQILTPLTSSCRFAVPFHFLFTFYSYILRYAVPQPLRLFFFSFSFSFSFSFHFPFCITSSLFVCFSSRCSWVSRSRCHSHSHSSSCSLSSALVFPRCVPRTSPLAPPLILFIILPWFRLYPTSALHVVVSIPHAFFFIPHTIYTAYYIQYIPHHAALLYTPYILQIYISIDI